ncbi:hypothetical protein F443_09264 [Phytophthora nicotianae P1569]|uniref:Uncharacterized protein n=2 Tax=Phytophthora nicotianae TaxID=4792 RepID=V9F498_PHYNI|nr:hypothetical protein F443_09264 [Phytophthora nicotianae P1569]ETO75016.1 hypothetical protein F444_09348 [Phytophthora nicotianae P1976]
MGSQRVGRFYVRTQRYETGSCRNHILSTTARNIVKRGSADVKTRGGARAASTKFTPEMEESLVEYQEDNCQYRLEHVTDMLSFDFGVTVSTSRIARSSVTSCLQ